MKSLIKLIIFALLITIASESFAQTFGVKAGVNFSNMLIKDSELFIPYNTNVADPKMKTGFHIGGVIEYPVFSMLSIESGLFLTTLGTNLITEEPFGFTTLVTKVKRDLYYLGIPLAAKVPFSIKGLDFYGSAGVYAGMGLIGNTDTTSTFGDLKETTKGKIAWGSEQGADNLKRFDYGLTFGAGIKYNAFQAGLFYNLGLANISSDSEIGSIAKNRVLGISVSYMFGGVKKSEPAKPKTEKVGEEKIKETPVKEKKQSVNSEKTEKQPKVRIGGKKEAALEAERLRKEKIAQDSIAAVRVEQERIRIEKVRVDSIEAGRKASFAVVYRVQFASNTTKKGSQNITIGGKNYITWEYSYNGAYRSTVGEFKTLTAAVEFQKIVRQAGYPQAFVVAFKNNIRTTDPALFK